MNTTGNIARRGSDSSCSAESIKEELEELKGRCQQLEIQECIERGILERQLEAAIIERREAKKKFKDLLEKVEEPLTHIKQVSDIVDPSKLGEESDSLPDLVSDSNSGDEAGKVEEREDHLPKQKQRGLGLGGKLSNVQK